MSSIIMIVSLPRLLHPQRLANITSLETKWKMDLIRTFTPEEKQSNRCWRTYSILVSTVGSAFPSIRRVYISLQIGEYPRSPTNLATFEPPKSPMSLGIFEQHLLNPMDEMVGRLGPQLQEFQVALPYSLYKALLDQCGSQGTRTQEGGYGALSWRRYWREVGTNTESRSGYWIRKGIADNPMPGESGWP